MDKASAIAISLAAATVAVAMVVSQIPPVKAGPSTTGARPAAPPLSSSQLQQSAKEVAKDSAQVVTDSAYALKEAVKVRAHKSPRSLSEDSAAAGIAAEDLL